MKVSIVGGGLWGGLLAYQLHTERSDLQVELHEAGATLGGKHTWSFHHDDVSPSSHMWLKPFVSSSWPDYEVKFPEYRRKIAIPYYSIRAKDFHRVITEALPKENLYFGHKVLPEEFSARSTVIDARGLLPTGTSCGYQKFLGLTLKLKDPHGLTSPVLMDATIVQKEGFRFFYLLPWDEKTLLIEDTRYALSGDVEAETFISEIQAYIQAKGWEIDEIIDQEEGSLPIPFTPLGFSLSQDQVVSLSGQFHDVTGYSLPDAVRVIDLLVAEKDPQKWKSVLSSYQNDWASRRSFYRMLNRLLFFSADEDKRYKVLEFFYRSSPASIGRFYSGNLGAIDMIRFFLGRPPVSVGRALSTIFKNGKPSRVVS